MSPLSQLLQREPWFRNLSAYRQKIIIQYLQLQMYFCIDIASMLSISDPGELRSALRETFAVMHDIYLSNKAILRDIINLSFDPDQRRPSPTPPDANDLSPRLTELQNGRVTKILKALTDYVCSGTQSKKEKGPGFWSWLYRLFIAKAPAPTQRGAVGGTKRAREDDDEQYPTHRIKIIRKDRSLKATNKQNSRY
ncbi:hypothetical protein FGADI_9030 [Fusarium gaditjirri]|uniref:Uncharacterized protein n=1 Tax=Fusarium gaditjirri TaxID=282569 RepID=A0A8H4T118_9HYPO|nr:hypothetical protein FGADI_9030 [Fusarium gaditjirri]